MIKFRKVDPRLEDEQDEKTRKIQKEYNRKVDALKACCARFEKYFKKVVRTDPPIYKSEPKSWQKNFKTAFCLPMRANKLTSRTSKVLHEIYKNLGKFQEEEFKTEKLKEYKEAFRFEAKKVETNKRTGKSRIKRSAIDNPVIVDYFMGENVRPKIPEVTESIPTVISNMYNSVGIVARSNAMGNAITKGINEFRDKKKNLKPVK